MDRCIIQQEASGWFYGEVPGDRKWSVGCWLWYDPS